MAEDLAVLVVAVDLAVLEVVVDSGKRHHNRTELLVKV